MPLRAARARAWPRRRRRCDELGAAQLAQHGQVRDLRDGAGPDEPDAEIRGRRHTGHQKTRWSLVPG